MSRNERENKRLDQILEIVKDILSFNKQNQEGTGLKILTPDQMLSRLPITLAQLKAGNNSEKLKNEIRQLLYSLYHSKNMTKQVYNSLINYIWIRSIIYHKIFIMIIIIIINTKSTQYKALRQFLWILRIIKPMNHTDLN